MARPVNGWPVVVLRDPEGALRAFHNVCRHRAAALFADGAGVCAAKIACPYHGWTYELDGRLSLAPRFGERLDPAEVALLPVRVDTWRGCVFVCVDRDAPDLPAWLGSVPGLCAAYPETEDLAYHGAFAVEGRANWKTYCDNTVEGYHLPFVHERLARSVEGGLGRDRGITTTTPPCLLPRDLPRDGRGPAGFVWACGSTAIPASRP